MRVSSSSSRRRQQPQRAARAPTAMTTTTMTGLGMLLLLALASSLPAARGFLLPAARPTGRAAAASSSSSSSSSSFGSSRIRAVAALPPAGGLNSRSSRGSRMVVVMADVEQSGSDEDAGKWSGRGLGRALRKAGSATKAALLPVVAAAASALVTGAQPAHAYRDLRMSPETRIVAAVLGRFIIPIGLCLYFAVNRKRMAREEARRVREALDAEQKKKEAYIAKMQEEGYNLGSVGGSLTKEEEDMLLRVEAGEQLAASDKAAWVKFLQRAQYSRDVVDGKAQPNPDVPIMTKRELKRAVAANKAVKEAGFKSD